MQFAAETCLAGRDSCRSPHALLIPSKFLAVRVFLCCLEKRRQSSQMSAWQMSHHEKTERQFSRNVLDGVSFCPLLQRI